MCSSCGDIATDSIFISVAHPLHFVKRKKSVRIKTFTPQRNVSPDAKRLATYIRFYITRFHTKPDYTTNAVTPTLSEPLLAQKAVIAITII